MRRSAASLGLLAAVAAMVLLQPLSAFADDIDDLCGDDPNCVVTGPFPDDPGSGIPGGFIALMVLAFLVAIGFTVYRVNVARGLAERSGMDPADATRITLLDDDGLSATYLAAQVRARPADPTPSVPPRSVAERLRELESLRTQGLVTDAEYAERRAAVLKEL